MNAGRRMNHVAHRHIVLIIILNIPPKSCLWLPTAHNDWPAQAAGWAINVKPISKHSWYSWIGVHATIIVKTMSPPTIVKCNVFVPCVPRENWLNCVRNPKTDECWWQPIELLALLQPLSGDVSHWLNSSEGYPQFEVAKWYAPGQCQTRKNHCHW